VIQHTQLTHVETGYVSYPPGHNAKAAVLYLTDIFGNALINNKLYAQRLPVTNKPSH
jgi:hypothetical protein